MNKGILTIGALAIAVASPAIAATSAIKLKGHVPVTCNVRASAATATVQGSLVQLGDIRELCNAPAGYDVFVDYSGNFAGTVLLVDGAPVELGKGGSVKFASEDGPALRKRELAIDIASVKGKGRPKGGSVSFRIVAR